ncbi:MAG: bifunctional UDP-N-acetylglucosamine diphosphorylase/glucosamine-1-phosphate N-acetyltransferase GlmU [Halioglobus sp.]
MSVEIIILAAGQGTRMQSSLPKVLHQVAGKSLLRHVIDTASLLEPAAIHVVVGHGAEQVQAECSDIADLQWHFQAERLGTGHAVMQAIPALSQDSQVVVLYGDVPLLRLESLQDLIQASKAGPALLTAKLANPAGYGRILRSQTGELLGVVEDKDASVEQRSIAEINTGVLASPAADLKHYLPQVNNDNSQGEYYLPDILPLVLSAGKSITSTLVTDEMDVLGVNDRAQLHAVEREYQMRAAQALMREGVTLADASRFDVRGSLRCGKNVFIDINAVFIGDVELGDDVRIGPNCVVANSRIGDDSDIHAFSHVEGALVERGGSVGPYARLRPGTELAAGARIGNFVETKKARIGAGSKVNHLSYVGDCEMGASVNVGAGTITCNYDGVNKHLTRIGDGVFVGSNSTLVAPVTIESEGFVAAGSTVTKTVGAGDLAVSRAKQRNIEGWTRPQKPMQGES